MKTQTRSSFGISVTLCALLSTATGASAVTAEVAKKCRALAIKAHPTARAGTKGGFEEAQRTFFNDCVAKDGKIDEPAGENPKGGNTGGK